MSKHKSLSNSQKVDLHNPEHVFGFLLYCLENMTQTIAGGLDNVLAELDNVPKERHDAYVQESFDRCFDDCIGCLSALCEVFMGNAPEIAIYGDWDAAALGRVLRKEFAFQLMTLSDEEREEFDTDESIVAFALNIFLQEGQQFMLSPNADHDETEVQAKALCEFLIHWTELLMQKSYPEELKVKFK